MLNIDQMLDLRIMLNVLNFEFLLNFESLSFFFFFFFDLLGDVHFRNASFGKDQQLGIAS